MEYLTESKLRLLLTRPLDVVKKEPLNAELLIAVLESHLGEGKKNLEKESCSDEMFILLNIMENSLIYLRRYKELSCLMTRIQGVLDWYKAGPPEDHPVQQ